MILDHHNHRESSSALSGLLDARVNKDARLIRRVVATGCAVNAFIMALKLFVGHYGHSDALVADGIHSLNDVAADLIMLLFIGISFRPADDRYSYGYGKFQTFSSFLISAALIFVSYEIAHDAVASILEYSGGAVLPRPSIWTVVVVIVSMFGKEFLFRYYRDAARRTDTAALLTNAWHHRSDAMASVATLIGVTFARFFGEEWRILDPCASLVLVVFILVPAVRMLIPAFTELMDKTAPASLLEEAGKLTAAVPGVLAVEYIKGRKNGHNLILNMGVSVNSEITVNQGYIISSEIERRLKKRFGPGLMLSVTVLPGISEADVPAG